MGEGVVVMRHIYGRDGYGPERYQPFSGVSLYQQMREVCQSKLDGVKAQKPIVKWAKHDSARLRAKECVKWLLRRVK